MRTRTTIPTTAIAVAGVVHTAAGAGVMHAWTWIVMADATTAPRGAFPMDAVRPIGSPTGLVRAAAWTATGMAGATAGSGCPADFPCHYPNCSAPTWPGASGSGGGSGARSRA